MKMANVLTICRIVLSLIILCVPPFSERFCILYAIAGLTDIADGKIARITGKADEFGAKLDTAADFVFVICCIVKLFPTLAIPRYISLWTVVIAVIKIYNVIYGFVCDKKFVAVHSKQNKLVGLALFVLPFTVTFIDLKYTGAAVCVVATYAAVNESIILRKEQKFLTEVSADDSKNMILDSFELTKSKRRK